MGGTYEPIDSVRGITNKSSGKMGLELAKQAYIRGTNLTLVVANVSVSIPSVFDVINVETGEEMMDVILDLIPDFDIFISTAAVSDFKFKKRSDKKIDSTKSLSIDFVITSFKVGSFSSSLLVATNLSMLFSVLGFLFFCLASLSISSISISLSISSIVV